MIYHGVRHTAAGALYRLGLALFDLERPHICIARGDSWIFGPEAPYECHGDVANVAFPCGLTIGPTATRSFSITAPPIPASLSRPAAFERYCVGSPKMAVL